jgi:PTH1 family peptidyl-tRNA hydrolase
MALFRSAGTGGSRDIRRKLRPPNGSPVADWLIVGLGNPGPRYSGTPHNIGFDVARALIERWELGKPKRRFAGLLAQGRAGAGGARVAVLLPQTFMNESGTSVGPARGALKIDLKQVLVVHDEIDLPFGEIRTRDGGGLAGHNGLKSLKQGLGSSAFGRVRVGVGRPDSSDPEAVSSYVLGKWRQSASEVEALVADAVLAVESVVL